MERDSIRERLQTVLGKPVRRLSVTIEQWMTLLEQASAGLELGEEKCQSVAVGKEWWFSLLTGPSSVEIIAVDTPRLTATERGLIESMLELVAATLPAMDAEEPDAMRQHQRLSQLRHWIRTECGRGVEQKDAPKDLAEALMLDKPRIPLLLVADYGAMGKEQSAAFQALLDQFFGDPVLLLPLEDREWLLLAPSELADGKREDGIASEEEELAAIAMGLHEMLAAEWDLESHVGVHYPIVPATDLLGTVQGLRQAIAVGREYRFGSNVHMPWTLRLETLLSGLSDKAQREFLARTLAGIGGSIDEEMLATLSTFFALDCNVSETAKHLYVHRNTLLYRLDKFKQETGLDVRSFGDAVLVRIALSLYKVTNRRR